jgi:hypothetical protein
LLNQISGFEHVVPQPALALHERVVLGDLDVPLNAMLLGL